MESSRERDEAVVRSITPGTVPTFEVKIETHHQGEVVH
jgi:hypothetical protein